MPDWEIWAVIGALALATAATRSGLWMLGHRVAIPPRVQSMLRFAPACALAAIIGPDLVLGPTGELVLTPANPKLLAAIASLAFYVVRKNMLHTIIFGMAVFTLLRISHVFAVAG